jgi:hypothetical protein
MPFMQPTATTTGRQQKHIIVEERKVKRTYG